MSVSRSARQPLLLLAVFMIGCGVIWHIGSNLSPVKQAPAAPAPEAQAKASAKLPEPAPERAAKTPAEIVPIDSKTNGMVRTSRGLFVTTEPILFNSGASTLREASIPKLDKIAEFLIRHPGVALQIVGHTDNLGPEPVNQTVSAERAALVMNYLISRGVDPSRLRSKGMGSLDPIESNETQLGRQANRRIEFVVDEGAAAGRP